MDTPRHALTLDSPLGTLTLGSDGAALTCVWFGDLPGAPVHDPDEVVRAAAKQLREFFAGTRRAFDLPLAPQGTPFQLRVWRALCEIPYGETESYGALAKRVGRPGGARAVGLANGKNPHAIIVPCHRVIGSDGSLTGYGGGLPNKRWLLSFERERAPGDLFRARG